MCPLRLGNPWNMSINGRFQPTVVEAVTLLDYLTQNGVKIRRLGLITCCSSLASNAIREPPGPCLVLPAYLRYRIGPIIDLVSVWLDRAFDSAIWARPQECAVNRLITSFL
jgi:hypothetical protein